jgi:hypothetical protein
MLKCQTSLSLTSDWPSTCSAVSLPELQNLAKKYFEIGVKDHRTMEQAAASTENQDF